MVFTIFKWGELDKDFYGSIKAASEFEARVIFHGIFDPMQYALIKGSRKELEQEMLKKLMVN